MFRGVELHAYRQPGNSAMKPVCLRAWREWRAQELTLDIAADAQPALREEAWYKESIERCQARMQDADIAATKGWDFLDRLGAKHAAYVQLKSDSAELSTMRLKWAKELEEKREKKSAGDSETARLTAALTAALSATTKRTWREVSAPAAASDKKKPRGAGFQVPGVAGFKGCYIRLKSGGQCGKDHRAKEHDPTKHGAVAV